MCPHSICSLIVHNVYADQAARQRRAAETVLLGDVSCGARIFRPDYRPAAPAAARPPMESRCATAIPELMAAARPGRPKAAARRGGAAVEYSVRSHLNLQQLMSRLTYLRLPTCRSESGVSRLKRALEPLIDKAPRSCEPAAARLKRAKACVRTPYTHRISQPYMRTSGAKAPRYGNRLVIRSSILVGKRREIDWA
jgi:hypothetical protein